MLLTSLPLSGSEGLSLKISLTLCGSLGPSQQKSMPLPTLYILCTKLLDRVETELFAMADRMEQLEDTQYLEFSPFIGHQKRTPPVAG